MSNELLMSRRDLEFQLYEWLDVVTLTKASRYADHGRETYDAVLDACERLANEKFAPHYQKADRIEPQFDGERVTLIDEIGPALQAFAEAGLPAATQDYERGGMQLPTVIEKAAWSYLCAANISTTAYPLLSLANARLLLHHGNAAQIAAFAEPQLRGEWFGTMCLSEPQAGSSLADVATRAQYEGESPFGPQYRVSGNKMWISGGDHELGGNIVHLVLARTVDTDGQSIPGVKGLSLLLVPKYLVNEDGSLGERNDVRLAGINHKMGYRGIVNTLLNFGEGTTYKPGGKAGAVGYLVGPLHGGLACMFHMMNEARIGIGLGATALGYTAYLHSLDYARHRPQGRTLGSRSSKQQPIIEHADVRRMLLAQKSYAEGALGLNLYCALLVDQARVTADQSERAALEQLLELLTPIAKSWPSQWCLAGNDLAIQIHGGYGYTREYKVEQFYRDNRLNPIHEGTHGIQALDLLGRKVTMNDGAALAQFSARVAATIDAARKLAGLAPHADALHAQLQRLQQVTRTLWSAGDPLLTLANASVYLEAFGHIVIAWIWLQQAAAAHGKDSDFHHGKRQAAQYFFAWELPKVSAQLDLLASLDRSTLDMRDSWF
ncbi:alkylation response protein AidB-like acyl-CoA dehydrogenase [Rhodanobacter sp. ANJX3]|uniref:acyl-CoA dehydrogenase n=1 Tax=unclassified Rhodanobacter TaxID=2621553 RepID=UPI0017CDA888|nr:alkylation response protein AidB-like acyl-CoA dehydrogenase [Rhodanobacter sp. ANJX3]NYE30967.1 alkylation response protein AidB-like acyl-CoA dehydrogenase [Rhodanobacter sp. K2T2]